MGNETHDGKKGGLLKGKRHYAKDGKPLGGIKAIVTDTGQQVELEGGEVIINREASKKHWKELSRINQSAGGGVPILPPDTVEADTEEYKRGGAIIDFNPNVLPSKWVYDYAKKIKEKYPKVWEQFANRFGNEAFNNLGGALKRGYWLDGEEWFYYKWKAFNTKHKGSSTLKDVIAALKWCTINSRGWAYMKSVIEAEIKKQYPKAEKLAKGKKIKGAEEVKAKTYKEWVALMKRDNNDHNKNAHEDDVIPFWEWVSEMGAMYGFKPVRDSGGDTIIIRTHDNPPNKEEVLAYIEANKEVYADEDGDLDESDEEKLAEDVAETFNIDISDAFDYIDEPKMKLGGNLDEFIPKQKYVVKYPEFNITRICRYVGLYKGKYHKFTDLSKHESFNIHESNLKDYEIVKAMKDGGNTEVITPNNKKFVSPTFVTRNSVKLLNVAVDNTDVIEINSLLKSVGVPFKVTKELGTGASGTAFLTNRKTVLKVTNESAEAYTSYIISISNFKNQAKVHNVFKITDGTRSMYFIEKEFVKVADSMQKKQPFPLDNLFLEAFSTGSSRVKEHYTDKEIVEVANDYYTEWIELFEDKNGEERDFTKDEVVGIKELKSKKKYIVEKLYNLFTFYRDIDRDAEEQDLDYNDVHAGNFGEVGNKFVCFDCVNGGERSFMLGGELAKGIKVEKEHNATIKKLFKRKITPEQAPKHIAKEHLKENPKYYTELEKMEAKFAGGGTLASFGLGNLKVGDKGIFNGLQTTVANITADKIYFTQGGGKTQYKRSYDTFAKNWNPISGKPSQQNTTTNSYNVGDYFRIDDWDGGTYATITAIEKDTDGDDVVYYNTYEFPSKREHKGDLGRRLFDIWVSTNEIIFLPKTYRNLWYKKGDTLVGNGSERLVHDIHTGSTYLQTPNADIRDVATKHVFERLENGDWKIQHTSLIEKPVEKPVEKPISVSYGVKTPTGEPSKLTYLQQMLVRTSAFKEFFGDWEEAAKKYIAEPNGSFNTFYHNVSKAIDLVTLEPRIMYHGTRTNEEFFVFDANIKDIGRPYAYFAINKEYAQQFTNTSQRGSGNTPVLYECFLNIRKPFMAVGIDFEIVEKKADYWLGKFAESILFDKHGLNKEDGAKTYEKIHKVVVSQIGKYAEKLCGDTDVPFWRFMSDDKKSVFKVFLMSHNYDSIEYGERIAPNIDYNNPKEYTMATTIFDSTQTKLGDGRNLDFDKLNPDIRFEDGGNLSAQANDKAEGSTNTPEQTNNANTTHKDKLGKVIFGDKYEHGGIFKGHTNNPINDDRAYVENLITKMKN